MFGQTRRLLGVLAGTTGLTLVLGVGASTGLVPKLATSESASSDQAAPETVTGGDSSLVLEPWAPPTSVVDAPPPTAPPTTTPAPKPTAPPVTKAPAPKPTAAPVGPAPVAAPAAALGAPVQALVARTVPTLTQVQAAITGLKALVPALGLFPVTPAQVADIGNQVCTAFDQGQSFAQVKATALSMVPTSIIVPPTAPDYAVRQAVSLYCPGHASKLV